MTARFVEPDGCICSVQFPLGGLIFVNLFCLFGNNELYICVSVHHKSIIVV